MAEEKHRSGFVSIIGKPNVGKSTLMNQLVGERLSIITSKAQTTRHRIMGIISDEHYQIVYSDTPGIIEPKYKLHEKMMSYVDTALDDADVILFITDIYEKWDETPIIERLKKTSTPIILLINKIDQVKSQEEVEEKIEAWKAALPVENILPISALHAFNTESILNLILEKIPEHPAYFDKEQFTDRTERFLTAEIIREKIFENYKKEVPYSCEVLIQQFKEEENIINISADILVERSSQKGIVIGHQGKALKKVGTEARKILVDFFQKKVFLELYVKVEEDWRKKDRKLDQLGYNH